MSQASSSPSDTVIVLAKRTPIGKFLGGLATIPAPKLMAGLIAHAVKELKVDDSAARHIDEVVVGQVLTAGVGQAPARQAAIFGGLSHQVPATTIGKVCGSGLKAVMLADQAIRAGDSHFILAGGQENMSLAPHLLPQSRSGYRFGAVEVRDSMQYDGLWDPYHNKAMGACAESCARKYGFSRAAQDEFALESYDRARKAIEGRKFDQEIVPVEVPGKKGPTLVTTDEEPFASDLSKIAQLKPAFVAPGAAGEGTITAANASSINDGAALLCLMSRQRASQMGLKPLAKVVAQASYAHEPEWFTTAPVGAIKKVLAKAGRKVAEVDLFEINEAFANVTMAAIKELELHPRQVNIHGGAVALGHPIGASGARILVTLVHALRQADKKVGLASLCIGGGEATAVLIGRED